MKKTLLFLLAVLTFGFVAAPLSAQTVWDGTADISWYDASQTSFDISTPEQLAGLASLVNTGNSFSGVTLNLTADIWLNADNDSTNNWTPIGGGSPTSESPTTGNAFKGNFNGHGHIIYNLYCDKGSTFHAGLFCALENPCTIDSLVMINPVLKSRGMMGCIAGYPRGSSSIYIRYCMVINARLVGENSSGSNNIGCICGATYPNSGSTYVQNCGATGDLTGYYIGGMCGNAERSYITNAYFAGTLTSYNTNFGGMTAHGGDRTNCYSYTEIVGTQSQSSASSHGTSVTQSEMQSENMITLLGDAFKVDNGVNNGYPVLSFMAGVSPAAVTICQNESVVLTAFGYDSYVWSTGATTESITVSPTTTTTYTVTCTLNGIDFTHTSTVTVLSQAVITASIAAGSDGVVHGTVTPETSTVACGSSDNITLTVTPDEGYRVERVTLNGEEVYGDEFGPGEQYITINPGGTLGEVKIYLSKCAILTLPFTDDMESYASSQVPECYTRISTSSYPYIYNYSSYAHSGSNCIYAYMYSTSDNYLMVLPKMFDMNTYPMESLMVSFWARTSSASNSVTVGVMTDPTNASTFTPVQTFTFATTGVYEPFTAYFGSVAEGKPYIAFKYNCGSTYTYIYMDDITVDVAPTCSPVTNLTVDNIYGTNASLHWQPNTVGETLDYLITVTDNAQVSTTYTTTETDYMLTGLNEQTAYMVAVQPNCGGNDYGAAVEVSFTTPCVAPIEAVNNSYPTSTYSTEGNHFPMSNHYLNSFTEQIYFPSDFNEVSAEFSGMSFQYNDAAEITRTLDIYMAHTNDSAFIQNVWATPTDSYVHVYSGPVTFNRNGVDRWVDIAFDTSFYYNGYENLLLIVNDITGSEVNNSNAKFYTMNTSGNRSQCEYSHDAGANWSINNMPATGRLHTQVDNIRLTACDMVGCIAPNTLVLGTVDASSAELTWFNPNASQSCELEYKAIGDADWTSVGTVSGTAYTLYGLDANTQYQIRVRAICGSNSESAWSETITFRTECDAIVELPYIQDFDSDTYGSGTEAYVYCWDRLTTDPSKPVQLYPTNAAHSTPNAIRFYDGANVTNIAIMPKVDESISLSGLQISFWVRSTSSSAPVILELGVMTDKSDPTTFEILDTIPAPYLSGDQYTFVEYSLANYMGYGQYIAFRASNGNGGNNLRLDDVTLDYIPVCQHPTDLMVDAVTSETVEVHWSEPGYSSSWIVEYGPAGFELGEGMVETANDTSVLISGLTPNTEYDLYVKSDCGGGFYSTTVSVSFRTDCGPIVELPYYENFETGIYTSASQQNYIVCWSRFASDPAHYVYVPSNTYAHGGTHFLDFHHTTNCYNIAIAPELDESFDVSTLMVNFWACRTGSSGTLEVGVMTDNDVESTFVPVDTIDLSAMNTYAYAEQFVKFNNYQGEGKYIAFRVSYASDCGFYIDDVTIDYAPDCSPVNNLAVSDISGTSAMVTWTPGYFGTVESYTLEYSEGGQENWVTVDNLTETSYLLGGLNHSTYYDVRVRPNCDNLVEGEWTTVTFHTNCLVGGDFTIGEGTATNSYLPSYSTYNYSYTQQLFLASEIGSPRSIESVTFEKVAGSVNRTLKIYLMHTSETSSSSWIDATNAQLVFDSQQPLQLQNGPNTFNFSTPFEYNGTDNLLLIVLDMTGSWTSGNTWRTHTAPFTASRYTYQDASAYSTSATPSSGTSTSSRNSVVFGAACDTTTTCVAPHITISAITSDGATVNWVAGYMESAWELEYRPLSDTNWISMGTVTSMAEVISGLMPNTAYKVRMRSSCGGGEYSFWTEESFTTDCGAFTVTESNPWTEDFEGYTSTSLVCLATPVIYTNSSGNTYPKVLLNYGEAAHSGGNTVEFKGNSNMLVLPEFTNDIHELRLSFWSTSWGVTTTAVVGVITDMDDLTSFEVLGDAGTPGPRGSSAAGNGNFMGPFDFNGIQATSGRIALLFTGTTASDAGWNMDDFIVEITPNCPSPVKTSVVVNNITSNTADVSWTDNDASHNSWTVYYKPTFADESSWQTVVANQTSASISGLSSSTEYQVYVITNCAVSDLVPDATQTVTFTTLVTCDPISVAVMPWTSGFEGTDDEYLSCWVSAATGYRNGHTYPHIEPTASIAHTGSSALEVAFGDIVTALPLFVEDISNLQLTFWAYNNHWSTQSSVLELGYMTDPYDSSTFVTLQTLTDQSYTQTTRTFADLAGLNLPSTTRIAFRYIRVTGTSDLTSWYIDDMEVSMANPPVVTDPTVTTNAATAIAQTTATLNGTITNPDNVTITAKGFEWKATSGGTYQPVNVTGNDLTYNLTNLTPNTGYTFKAFITFNGTTVYGNELTFTTLPDDTPEPCDVPTNLHYTNIENHAISVAWDANANVSSWNVQYRPAAGGQWTQVTVNTNSCTITNLDGKTLYEIQVQANCGDGNFSDWSASINVETTDVGIDEHLFNSITLYPNPANEVVNVQCTMNNVQCEGIEVIDVYGKVVRTVVGANDYSPVPTRINVSGLTAGLYFVRVTTDAGTVTKTFVKK